MPLHESCPQIPFDPKTLQVKRFFVPTHGANTHTGWVPVDRRIDTFVVAQVRGREFVQTKKINLETGVIRDLVSRVEEKISPDGWPPTPKTVFVSPASNNGFSAMHHERGEWVPIGFTALKELPNE